MNVARPGLLQRFFDFYSVFFGITAPPPSRQKLFVALLLAFFVGVIVMMVVVGKLVSAP